MHHNEGLINSGMVKKICRICNKTISEPVLLTEKPEVVYSTCSVECLVDISKKLNHPQLKKVACAKCGVEIYPVASIQGVGVVCTDCFSEAVKGMK